jgi:hypothetical protein
MRPEAALLLDAARVVLDTGDIARIQTWVQGKLDWDYLLLMAGRHGVIPLLHRSLGVVGRGIIPGDVLDRLRGEFQHNIQRNLRLTAALLNLLDQFQTAGLTAIPYKGPTLAALAYGNLAFREYMDLDLLLHRPDLAKARDLLIAQGFRLAQDLTPHEEAAYIASLGQLPLRSKDGILVELHVTLALRDYGFRIDPDRLWVPLSTVSLLGRDVPTFSVENLLLILCTHGGSHCWGMLGWICDVAELVRTHRELRWDWMMEQATKGHVRRLLLLGMALASDLLRAPIPEPIQVQIERDPAIPWLSATVGRWLFSEDGLPGMSGQLPFHFRVRERWRDGARYCLSTALVPRISDWEALTLPPSLSFVYPFLRALRLARKYGVGWLRGRERPRGSGSGR